MAPSIFTLSPAETTSLANGSPPPDPVTPPPLPSCCVRMATISFVAAAHPDCGSITRPTRHCVRWLTNLLLCASTSADRTVRSRTYGYHFRVSQRIQLNRLCLASWVVPRAFAWKELHFICEMRCICIRFNRTDSHAFMSCVHAAFSPLRRHMQHALETHTMEAEDVEPM